MGVLSRWKVILNMIDENFVDIKNEILDIIVDVPYAREDNFLGETVDGYNASKCYLTKKACINLKKVQEEANRFGLCIKVFDSYRPKRAVDHFIRWAKDPLKTKMKKKYYPHIDKKDLIPLGYLSANSAHSRGSTLDLTLVKLDDRNELDMGTYFDFFDPRSNTTNIEISFTARKNRLLLKSLMEKYGFVNFYMEWWHFTLKDEPFIDTYFDFIVK